MTGFLLRSLDPETGHELAREPIAVESEAWSAYECARAVANNGSGSYELLRGDGERLAYCNHPGAHRASS